MLSPKMNKNICYYPAKVQDIQKKLLSLIIRPEQQIIKGINFIIHHFCRTIFLSPGGSLRAHSKIK